MFARNPQAPALPAVAVTAEEAPAAEAHRQPIFVVCSPRPRVGCTLIARLLVEYLASDGRRPLAFDVTPDDRALARHLPLQAVPATLADTRGEMALFDRLILNDGAPKVVDLAADLFDAFFDVMRRVGFAGEAHARSLDVIVLFVSAGDHKSAEAYRRLFLRRGPFTVVPVVNAANQPPASADPALPPGSPPPLAIGSFRQSPPTLFDRPDFSFADALKRPANHPAALTDWVERTFLAFRDLELQLQMAAFADLFRLFSEPA